MLIVSVIVGITLGTLARLDGRLACWDTDGLCMEMEYAGGGEVRRLVQRQTASR